MLLCPPHVATIITREDHGLRGGDLALADLLAIYVQGRGPALAKATTSIGKLGRGSSRPARDHVFSRLGFDL
jgi:hypothetical protein